MIIQAITKQVKLSKAGKPYASVAIQFDEYKDGKGNRKWISGFGNKFTWAWKIGDDVQPDITETNGYLNFTFRDEKENSLDVYRLPATVGFVLDLLKGKEQGGQGGQDTSGQEAAGGSQAPTEEVNPEDIPF